MKNLIFLLFIIFAESLSYVPTLSGEFENIICIQCPEKIVLIKKEYMVNGSKIFNTYLLPNKMHYEEKVLKLNNVCSPSYVRIYNNTGINTCPCLQLKLRNKCTDYQSFVLKVEYFNTCEKKRRVVYRRIRKYIHRFRQLVAKPVIYLYPKETMDISVEINIKNSKFTTIYPRFNEKNTWNVRAKPNGDILIKDRTYPYLFWEAQSYAPQETNEGFIVSEENAEKFLEEKLEILGLNEKEKTDFITFWLPKILKNKISLCSFQSKKFFDNFELNISPKPDSLIRVFLTIKKLDSPITIKEQKLVSNQRKGFTVIEWGGSNF